MLDLPRSARLAAWGAAVAGRRAALDRAVAAVQREDEPHTLRWSTTAPALPGGASATTLRELLPALPAGSRTEVVLPAPGDPVGLPGPADVNAEALDAGECVVLEVPGAPQRWALVPAVEVFGSAWEPGVLVEWAVHAALPRRAPAVVDLPTAERELRTALTAAVQALAALDVARWRPDAADRIAAVREGGLRPDALPSHHDPRAVRVAQSAAQVMAIVELAGQDDGAAVTGYEVAGRGRALREVADTARRALAAAVNAGSAP
ncbi:hypothetical protein [Kineococcus glutinatus]|uniref:hypothetical protein n=1 Tax=Kineococcus glutinatus TaxID=1070872 RepID=UPI0031F06754